MDKSYIMPTSWKKFEIWTMENTQTCESVDSQIQEKRSKIKTGRYLLPMLNMEAPRTKNTYWNTQ